MSKSKGAQNVIKLDDFIAVEDAGVVPDSSGAAAANTTALKALISPSADGGSSTFKGTVRFQSGGSTYYFNSIVTIRDGIHLDLNGCTINFTKAATVSSDINAGFFYGVRDFSIENGAITVSYNRGANPVGTGDAIRIGNRGDDGDYFQGSWDSLLSDFQGNVLLKNLKITSTNPTSNGVYLTGGLRNVTLQNISVEGQALMGFGVQYEFGWATDEANAASRQSAHANNLKLHNIRVNNLATTSGNVGIAITGAYNCEIDGVWINKGNNGVSVMPGEAMFYRPWVGQDVVGAKRTILLKNINVFGITNGNCIAVSGSVLASGTYLASLGLGQDSEVDLQDVSIENFALNGGSGSWGIYTTANRTTIKNGFVTGNQRGIVVGDDATKITIEGVDVVANTQHGILLNQGGGIYSPVRKKVVEIRNCFIAGNSTSSANTYAGINMANVAEALITSNRIGYESGHDGVSETTQGDGIFLASACANVRCVGNYVGGTGGVAYDSAVTTFSGNSIEGAGGTATTTGVWEGVPLSFTATLTGCTTAPTYTVSYVKRGNIATIEVPATTGTSNATTKTLTGMITGLKPVLTGGAFFLAGMVDNGGAFTVAQNSIGTDGVINFFKDATSAAFTNSGTYQSREFSLTYRCES